MLLHTQLLKVKAVSVLDALKDMCYNVLKLGTNAPNVVKFTLKLCTLKGQVSADYPADNEERTTTCRLSMGYCTLWVLAQLHQV